jgi:hypothetical protein
MRNRPISVISVIFILSLLVSACLKTNPQPPAFTPIPTLAQDAGATLMPELQPASNN